MSRTILSLAEAIAPAWRPPFRGQIYDYARKLDLQGGYAVKGPVRIETLPHLVEPLQAIRDPRVRLVSIMGAVQTTKSLIADIVVPYWIEHDPGDCLWLLEDDKKAREYADRAINLIKSVPEIAAMLDDVDRSDNTRTYLKFRHMKVLMCGLNAGNVQSMSWRYVINDETWLHPFDGLIRQAMDRTKQYPDTHKIILLGQGGVEDDDHDTEHKKTDQRELHWACPSCGRYQPFELSRLRPDEFPVPKLRGSYAGLSWDTNDVTRPGGKWNFEELDKTAHHKCYFCDFRIEDRPEVRRRLGESFRYFPKGMEPPNFNTELTKETKGIKNRRSKIEKAAADGKMSHEADSEARFPLTPALSLGEREQAIPFPKAVGFHWPGEASARIPFAYLVRKYIRAKAAAEEQGYKLPLKEYWQKDRGLPWCDLVEGEYRAVVRETYDAKALWEEEFYRVLIADCQKDLKKFFPGVYSVSQSGEVRELARLEVDSFKAIAALQAEWKVKDQHVFLDCGYQMTAVLRECVQHGHVGTVKVGGKSRKVWLCWTGMKGSGQELFLHENPHNKTKEYRIYSPRRFYDTNIGTGHRQPRSPWYEWSNLHCKDLLRARRDQDAGVPKFLTLPDTLPATDLWSYYAQMRSEKRIEDYKGGKKRSIWLPIKLHRPNHEWDKGGMLMAFMGIVGIIGAPEAETDDTPQLG